MLKTGEGGYNDVDTKHIDSDAHVGTSIKHYARVTPVAVILLLEIAESDDSPLAHGGGIGGDLGGLIMIGILAGFDFPGTSFPGRPLAAQDQACEFNLLLVEIAGVAPPQLLDLGKVDAGRRQRRGSRSHQTVRGPRSCLPYPPDWFRPPEPVDAMRS